GRISVSVNWSNPTPYTLSESGSPKGWQAIVCEGVKADATGDGLFEVTTVLGKGIHPIKVANRRSTVTRVARYRQYEVTEVYLFDSGALVSTPVAWTLVERLPTGQVR